MKTSLSSTALACVCAGFTLLPLVTVAQTTGTTVTGGSVKGGDVTGGSVTGGSVTGGSVTGSSVTGGSVTGGSVTGGKVTPGTATSGTVTPGSVGAGTATVSVDGREVTAKAEGSVSIQGEGTNAVVTLGSHKLVVEKERLLLDGKERGKLPAGARKVSIGLTSGRLTVQADGAEVLSAPLESK